ncbi:hypothetical protein RJT34_04177 [Clitoria ternatea]|uniref:RING-type E3 ubiquitin transferase n=1 Tax=Clitoria ternatea TaxID=43366 RepID=A0AAN9KM41_CLITE
MGLHNRKLLCETDCTFFYYSPPPPTPFFPKDEGVQTPSKHNKTSTYLIISFSLVATAFFVLSCYAIYAKFFSGWNRTRRRRRASSQQQTEDEGDFFDEENGPVIDHPIWYIRTTGLQQSIIGAISVCKYKRGEGLIEGTECSVCLSEFQEDESLRLLPKCNHAFHLPCIDTWLRSHTNCPLCRAPIVTDPTRVPSMDHHHTFASTSLENEVVEGSSGRENGVVVDQLRNGEEEEGGEGGEVEEERRVCEETEGSSSGVVNMQPRRSVSLDSSAAAKINLALATVVSVESHGNSKRVSGNGNLASAAKGASFSSSSRIMKSEPSSMKRSNSFNAKHLLSWYGRSQRKPNAPLRSF